MSIIHEALKKAGEPMVTEAPQTAADNRSGFRPELLRKKSRSNWGPFVAMLVLVLVGAPVFMPMLSNRSKANSEISVGSPLSASAGNMKHQFAIEEAPIPMMPAASLKLGGARAPRFSLNGIVYAPEDSYALINGKVIRVGDHVGDATLTQVTPNEAVLDLRGEKIVLPADAS